MSQPTIICHMVTSIDGKVTGNFLSHPAAEPAIEQYYALHRRFDAQGFACGRVTMEGSFTGGFKPDLAPFEGRRLPKEDFIARKDAAFYAVAFDRHGRLGWTAGALVDNDPGYDGAHIINVMCKDVPEAVLNYYRHIGVSYILAGQNGELDLPEALHKLHTLFGIETLLLEGGAILNGAFLREDLVDELSLVVAPVTGDEHDRSLFTNGTPAMFRPTLVDPRDDGVVYLRYTR